MELLDLFGDGDSDTSGKCCSGLGDIKEFWFKVGTSTTPKKLQCMNVQGSYDTWLLCELNPKRLMEIRSLLIISIIKASLRSKGFLNVNVFLPGADDLNDWTWKDQESWVGLCKSGKRQSPIDLDRGRAESVDYLSVRFAFSRAKDAASKWNGHEQEIIGDFGKAYLRKEIGQTSYMASKIVFKFPSEHAVMNNFGGEMQVHMTSQDGEFAIMSFFLEYIPGTGATPNNKFLDNLSWEKWRTDTQDPINLVSDGDADLKDDNLKNDRVPNIDYLIFQEKQSGDKKFGDEDKMEGEWLLPDIFRKSFFWYTGSMSTPPCKEGIQRFVFEQPIYVPQSQFDLLKEKSFNTEIDSSGNARSLKPQGKTRVYYHVDNGVKCAQYSASMATETSMDSWDTTKVKENMTVDLSKVKKTWLRASNIMTTYGYTGAEVPDFEAYGLNKLDPGARQSVALSLVDPEDPKDSMFPIAKGKLLKEAQKQLKDTCKKDSESYSDMQKNASKEAIKIPWFDGRRRRR